MSIVSERRGRNGSQLERRIAVSITMKTLLNTLFRFFKFFGVFLLLFSVPFAGGAEPLRPCDILLDREGVMLYTLESGASQIRQVREDGSGEARTAPLPVEPVRMIWVPGEEQIAVVGGIGGGELVLVRVKDAEGNFCPPEVEKTFPAGHSPSDAAAVIRDGRLLFYVADRFAGVVRELDGETGEILREFDGGREPYAVKITPDGSSLVVAGLVAEHRADAAYTTALVRVVDLKSGEVTPIELFNGTSSLYDLAISPDGRFAFVTGTNANYHTVTSQVIDGWIVHNIISVVEIPTRRFVEMIYLDNTFRGAPNPWGIVCGEEGGYLAIALSGSGEVLFLSFDSLMSIVRRRLGETDSRDAGRAEKEPFRIRVSLGLRGTRRLVLRGNTA